MNEPIDRYLDKMDADSEFTGYSADDVLALACANPRGNGVARKLEAFSGEFAPFYAAGQVYTFINTVDELFVCQVDVISKSGKVFAYGENPRSFNGLFYQRIDTIPTLQPAPKWLTLRAMSDDDCNWIEQMRDDQLTPEDDREFVRNEDLPRW